MALDIRYGDILVLGGEEYPIKGVARWNIAAAAGMVALMDSTAGTKRAPAMSGGKRGAAQTNLTDLVCTPLLSLSDQLTQRPGLQTPVQEFEVYVNDADAGAVVRLVVEDKNPLTTSGGTV